MLVISEERVHLSDKVDYQPQMKVVCQLRQCMEKRCKEGSNAKESVLE